MATKKKINWKKWLILALCGMAGSIIYRLPYLRETYYAPLQVATGATNAELGFLMSAYGIGNFLMYLPGGWFADKFSARKLMGISLVSTGLVGFYFATMPSYPMIVAIHFVWAITSVLTFWAVCVRVIRELGDSKEQGRLYGLWFFAKGVMSMLVGFLSVPLFAHFGEGLEGLQAAIIFYSIVCVLVGVACWFLITDDKLVEDEKSAFRIRHMKEALKQPSLWVAGVVTFCMWSIYIGFGMITPYFSDIFKMSETNAALVSILRVYVLLIVGGLLGGILADKCRSRIRFIIYATTGMLITSLVYVFLPGDSKWIAVAIVNMVLMGAAIQMCDAVYFSLIDEVDIPTRVTGTAAGLLSVLTYFPEIYAYTWVGNMVDSTPGIGGYKNVFIYMTEKGKWLWDVMGKTSGMFLQSLFV